MTSADDVSFETRMARVRARVSHCVANKSPCYVSTFAKTMTDLSNSQRRQATIRIVELLKRDKSLQFKIDTIGREYFAPRTAGSPMLPLPPPSTPRRVAPSPPMPPPLPPSALPGTFVMITTHLHLETLVASADLVAHDGPIGVDVLGPTAALAVLQLTVGSTVFFIDCKSISPALVWHELRATLQNPFVPKIVFNVYAFGQILGAIAETTTVCPMAAVLDLELAMEAKTGAASSDAFHALLAMHGMERPPKEHCHARAAKALGARPLSHDLLETAAWHSLLLQRAYIKLQPWLCATSDRLAQLEDASSVRITAALTLCERQVAFDAASQQLTSVELLPQSTMATSPTLVLHDDNVADVISSLLPAPWAAHLLVPEVLPHVHDIDLDVGRRPWAWVGGKRLFLAADPTATVGAPDVARVVAAVGGFGTDNRAGLARQLHRVSAMRNRHGDVVGVTVRMGRYVEGCAGMLADILADTTKNVLFLGAPGCGKTTLVRDVARHLSQRHNVCIIDTSNEIAGDGDVPHHCVGLARRMMVPCLNAQAAVMVECVQNHTPEVLVIDEIGRATEVEAARTCQQRGVRTIASAHGTLRKLLKNKPLRGLVGGVEAVTVGDANARKGPDGSVHKVCAERCDAPIFDVIVELAKGEYDTWRVVLDAAVAVDAILQGHSYEVQVRTRSTTAFSMSMEQA
ncbi:hypothetical protein SPRG_01726 [Saprolegnia parasitica CBS 223.65]|uniref:AAA+ ATPase domain-containing protein n=1 Tax=Saprolegnia parasitica (strain CBS 223.65) TaxID=695850 RepID=A0A067D4A0_SAPPC|nr:hypothetical protein SPRG_01726 [Saprolegnia parasitica CBS 223.65]KDO33847.1 hypothetical protein SPRG_01726 [Saprolegnia parasitica CBS 223.65]|eukprot:XP_012195483.1 hypothetical protein SPRG_01726 [Saprolegnia parasitica CBS 223.65]